MCVERKLCTLWLSHLLIVAQKAVDTISAVGLQPKTDGDQLTSMIEPVNPISPKVEMQNCCIVFSTSLTSREAANIRNRCLIQHDVHTVIAVYGKNVVETIKTSFICDL